MCQRPTSPHTPSSDENQQPSILIIGGGPAGLALAAHLLSKGWKNCRIAERRSRDYLLADTSSFYDMAASGIQALLRIADGAAAPAVFREAVAYDKIAFYGRKSSTPFVNVEMTGRALGMPMFNITRSALLTSLVETVEKLDPNCIEYEITAQLMDPNTGTVEITKGKEKETVQADLVVGADGIHSRLRKHIFGDTGLRSDGIVACYAVLPPLSPAERATFPKPPGVGDAFGILGLEADFCQYTVVNDKATIWYTNFIVDDKDNQKPDRVPPPPQGGWLGESKRRCQGGIPAMEALIAKTKEEDLQVVMCCDRLPVDKYSSGKVVLVGDAAHPFTPFAGLGSSQAMVDAFCLAEALLNNSPLQAVQIFEQQRVQEANKLMNESRELCNPSWSNKLAFAALPWIFKAFAVVGKEESFCSAIMAPDGNSKVNQLVPFQTQKEEQAYEQLYEQSKATLQAQLQ